MTTSRARRSAIDEIQVKAFCAANLDTIPITGSFVRRIGAKRFQQIFLVVLFTVQHLVVERSRDELVFRTDSIRCSRHR
jgi:hypothetical protein